MKVNAKEHSMTHTVYFNGLDIGNICVAADDEAGTAEVLIAFAGNLDYGVVSILLDEGGERITTTLHGDVRIEEIK